MIVSQEQRSRLSRDAEKYTAHLDIVEQYLLGRGISKEAAKLFGLGGVPDGENRGRLAIPYYTPAGVVAMKMRCTVSHDCKQADCRRYNYTPGTGLHLYNAQVLIHTPDRVVVTEGELDAICVQAYTAIPAVAYPGVDTWAGHPHFRLCFEGVGEVIVVADGDKPGREAARRVAESIGMSARVVNLPSGDDSNSYVAAHGASAFINLID